MSVDSGGCPQGVDKLWRAMSGAASRTGVRCLDWIKCFPKKSLQRLDKCRGVVYLVTCWRERPTNYLLTGATMSLVIIALLPLFFFFTLKGIK
jgi:hypothetical protein